MAWYVAYYERMPGDNLIHEGTNGGIVPILDVLRKVGPGRQGSWVGGRLYARNHSTPYLWLLRASNRPCHTACISKDVNQKENSAQLSARSHRMPATLCECRRERSAVLLHITFAS